MGYKDPQKQREYNAAWVSKNKERNAANVRAWHAKNPGYYAAQHVKHRDARLVRDRAARIKNREQRMAASRAWYASHKEEQAAYRKLYRAANKSKLLALKTRRRLRLSLAGPGLTAREWIDALIAFDFSCAYCRGPGPLERDHVYPLSRGGSDGPENVVPTCRGCNASKRASLPIQWMLKRAQL